ncbi:MAG TPA: lactate utilization protein [Acidimicrobiia bacterium]|jgi:L-lactate dehydrogenase complex protein LldG
MERDRFLARVAGALLTARIPTAPDAAGGVPEPDGDLLTLFRSRAQEVSAVVHGPVSRHGAERVVAGIASGHGSSTFVAWDDLPAPGVVPMLESAGLTRVPATDGGLDRFRQLDLGVTGAAAALAESGSVVLIHGPGRPRLASLVPDVHVVLVEIETIQPSLAHWAHSQPEPISSTANLVVVTGPSRTGDIELQLNLGVHGPRHVHVVLID